MVYVVKSLFTVIQSQNIISFGSGKLPYQLLARSSGCFSIIFKAVKGVVGIKIYKPQRWTKLIKFYSLIFPLKRTIHCFGNCAKLPMFLPHQYDNNWLIYSLCLGDVGDSVYTEKQVGPGMRPLLHLSHMWPRTHHFWLGLLTKTALIPVFQVICHHTCILIPF